MAAHPLGIERDCFSVPTLVVKAGLSELTWRECGVVRGGIC
jgi:hypothetical protein